MTFLSDKAGWVPLADHDLGVANENATSHPAPGQVLWHPPGLSEAELLVPYGNACFSSRVGQLAGNHFMTLTYDRDSFAELGRRLLWEGAQPISFELTESTLGVVANWHTTPPTEEQNASAAR